MGKLVIGKQISVPVIDAAPATLNRSFLFDLHLKGVKIFFSMDDLKIKNAVEHYNANAYK